MTTDTPRHDVSALLRTLNALRLLIAEASRTFDGRPLAKLPASLPELADALGAVQVHFVRGEGFLCHGTLRFAATPDGETRARVCERHSEMGLEFGDEPGFRLRLSPGLERYAASLAHEPSAAARTDARLLALSGARRAAAAPRTTHPAFAG